MPANSSDLAPALASLSQQLACPACHGVLQLHPGHLLCTACARRYPILDGIPILIPAAAQ